MVTVFKPSNRQTFPAMRSLLLLLLVHWLSAAPLHGQAFDCTGDFFLVLSNGSSESQLYRVAVDPLTEAVAFDPLATTGAGTKLNAIGYRRTDNFIYGLNPSTYELYRLDATGLATPLATLFELVTDNTGYFAADISPDGQFLVLLGSREVDGARSSQEIVFVDLDKPTDPINRLPLQFETPFFCTDIAFDPLSGVLFGFDLRDNRLLTIDPNTGQVDQTTYSPSNRADAMGALFFDPFGRLYGYGDDPGANESRRFFRVDIQTGTVWPLAEGPLATDKDGCSCPYTIRLEKSVSPRVASPCTEVRYTFVGANASGESQTGVDLLDELPPELTIVDILRNPYGGTVGSGPGTNLLLLENLSIPPGVDSVTISVRIAEGATGVYANQATLSGFPVSLGEETISDDPQPLPPLDSTRLEVRSLRVAFAQDTLVFCREGQLSAGVAGNGLQYLWSDGRTDSVRTVTEGGWYRIRVTSPCEVATDSIFVRFFDPQVELGPDLEITLGDSLPLAPILQSPEGLELSWTDPLGNSLSCLSCENPTARPTTAVTYTLTVSDGVNCSASDAIQVRVIRLDAIYAPNIFSPNDDGVNDFFFLQGAENVSIPLFRIFDRWGGLQYEARDLQLTESRRGWDGRSRDRPLPTGVYVWYAQIRFPDGTEEWRSGDVSLIR